MGLILPKTQRTGNDLGGNRRHSLPVAGWSHPGGAGPAETTRKEPSMAFTNSVVERYGAVWNEADPGKRRELIGQTFSEDGTYLDPMLSGAGHAGIDTMIQGVQAQLPGARVSLISGPEEHHGWVRFSWKLVLPGEDDSFIEGTDVGLIGPDGRFERMIGFLDKVPAAIAG
jgi:hypothetical protein